MPEIGPLGGHTINPVVESCFRAYNVIDIVSVSDARLKEAAAYLNEKMLFEAYSPRTWRTHPLHLLPPEPFSFDDPETKTCLDWIFLISSLNFSFWSEKEDRPDRYGVEWRAAWTSQKRTVWTGYWSLVASINRALEEGIPITDPKFYSSEDQCPDSLIMHVFRPAPHCTEEMPLLRERIAILRQNGSVLCKDYDGSFLTFVKKFQNQKSYSTSAVDMVLEITKVFPTFRDQINYHGHEGTPPYKVVSPRSALTGAPAVILWKRAQILVAETWAAFYPKTPTDCHPVFPKGGIDQLTMFADYRVPQVLHHLQILHYPQSLIDTLESKRMLMYGSPEEVSIRVASILAVERIRDEILDIQKKKCNASQNYSHQVNSVLIDFFLWDLAKRIERGEEVIEGIQVNKIVPPHRTRSIWY